MNHKTHLALMGGLVLVGAVVLLTGTGGAFGGGGLFLLVLLGFCFAMMVFMMRSMGGQGGMGVQGGVGGDRRSQQHGTDMPPTFEDDSPRRR